MAETETTTAEGSGLVAGTKVAVYRGTWEGGAANVVAPAALTLVTGAEDARTFTPVNTSNPVPVTVTGATGTMPVTVSGTVAVTDNASSLTVDGTVAVSAVGGTVTIQDGGNSITVDGTVAARMLDGAGANALTSKAAGAERALTVAVVDAAGNQITSFGGGGSLTEPVSIDDNGGSITVDGTVGIAGTVTVTGSVSTSGSNPGTATVTTAATSSSNATLKAANASRLGLVIFNDSTGMLFLKFGGTASVTDYTEKVDPQMPWYNTTRYTGVIHGIQASPDTGTARVTELTA
jgi:hypothetical protein